LGRGLSAAIVAALGATSLEACVHHAPSLAATPALGMWTLRVKPSAFPALATVGGIVRVDGESDKPVAVVRHADGFAAYSMRCPHAGATIDPVDGGFLCPGHGAKFDANGTWVGGHAAKNLKVLDVSYDASADVLTITG